MKTKFDDYAEQLRTRRFTCVETDWITPEIMSELRMNLFDELAVTTGYMERSTEIRRKLEDWLMWSFVPLFKRYDTFNRNLQVVSCKVLFASCETKGDFEKGPSRSRVSDDVFVAILNLNPEEVVINSPFGNACVPSGYLFITEEPILRHAYHLNDNEWTRMLFAVNIRLTEESSKSFERCLCWPWLKGKSLFESTQRRAPSRDWILLIPNNDHYMGHLCM